MSQYCECIICVNNFMVSNIITTPCCSSLYCKECYNDITSYIQPVCVNCNIKLARSTIPNENFSFNLEKKLATNKNFGFVNMLEEFNESLLVNLANIPLKKPTSTNTNKRSITPPPRTRSFDVMSPEPFRQEELYNARKKRVLDISDGIIVPPLKF